MNIRHAHHQAQGVRTKKQAARLYNDIEYELALGEHPPEHEAEGERALRHLEDNFPGVKDAARDVTEPPHTSRSANRNLNPAPRSSSPRRGGSEPRPAPSGPAPTSHRQRARHAAGAAAGRAGSLARTAYDTASDTTTGELIGEIVIGGLVLSIFYLFLTRAAAAGKLFQGATTAVRLVVSPVVDPLNPKGALL